MEMKCLRSVEGHILYNHNVNEDIGKIEMKNLNEIIVDYRCKWAQHLLRINYTHSPQLIY
jgi:hypothetical protein